MIATEVVVFNLIGLCVGFILGAVSEGTKYKDRMFRQYCEMEEEIEVLKAQLDCDGQKAGFCGQCMERGCEEREDIYDR